MRIAQAAFGFLVVTNGNWRVDWAYGLPLIVLNVVIHVVGLGLISQRAIRVANGSIAHHHPTSAFVLLLGNTTLVATILHWVEASIWAIAYRLLGAIPDYKSAMLYSLNAMTSYGHENLSLEARWQLMGAMEALNGWLLFGLTTAFLFGMMQRVWLLSSREGTGSG
jgi:hypothetical protein